VGVRGSRLSKSTLVRESISTKSVWLVIIWRLLILFQVPMMALSKFGI
jgi:hypothetical protein